ncbi:hypothetical protein FA95DRAFT_1608325 [Auriscalpium vulgare]|uniref:Uncharacterized protein n=1 Tax=Auriscalpium vulgare TaxID=40419 RepID=A0ACB8RLA3_9AGAM|nr:hypothetical protein FA95DRAFT_1608325 [Auriscalpium vulgare]
MSGMDVSEDADNPARERGVRRHSTGTSTTTRHSHEAQDLAPPEIARTVKPDGRLHDHLDRDDWRAEPTTGVVHHETCVCDPCCVYAKHLTEHQWSGDQSLVRAMAARDAAIVRQTDLGQKIATLQREIDDLQQDGRDLEAANDRLRDEADDLREENDRLHAATGKTNEENTQLRNDVADLRDDVKSLRIKLRDAEDDMHRERRRKVSPPSPDVAPARSLADRMPKLPLADCMAPTTGRTLLTPAEDGTTRHTYIPAHVLNSERARTNMAAGIPPPLGHIPVGGKEDYLADTDPATIAAVNSLFARARAAPYSAAAVKARHFMHRVSLTPAERHSEVHRHALAAWNTTQTTPTQTTAMEHAPPQSTSATTSQPPSKKRGMDKGVRPSSQESPDVWRQWMVGHPDATHLRQHTRGVGTSDEFPIRNVRGYVATMRLAPPRGKARSAYMLSAATLFGVPQAYKEALEEAGETVATERHDTPMRIDYDPSIEEVAVHFARNGLTLAEADDYWVWGQEFIATFIMDVDPSPKHPARIAYNSMNSTPHLPPTLDGFPDDHETTFQRAHSPLASADVLDAPPMHDEEVVDAPSPRF